MWDKTNTDSNLPTDSFTAEGGMRSVTTESLFDYDMPESGHHGEHQGGVFRGPCRG